MTVDVGHPLTLTPPSECLRGHDTVTAQACVGTREKVSGRIAGRAGGTRLVREYSCAVLELCPRHGPAPPRTPQRSPGATHTAIAFSITPRENRWACRRDTTGEGVHVRRRQAMPPSRLPPALHASNPHDRLHLSRPNPSGLRVPDGPCTRHDDRETGAFTSTAVMWTNGYITHAVEQ